MKQYSDRLTSYRQRFDRLSLRERILILLAVLVIIQMLWSTLFLNPQQLAQAKQSNTVSQDQQGIRRLELQIKSISGGLSADPHADIRTKVEQNRQALQRIQDRISEAANTLIEPDEMARLLEQLLLKQEGLQLMRLETMQTQPLLSETSDASAKVAATKQTLATVFRHSFAVEFSGDYFSTLDYLQAIEQMPWRFFWDSVNYRVDTYPQSRVRIELHTLSLSEDWIGV